MLHTAGHAVCYRTSLSPIWVVRPVEAKDRQLAPTCILLSTGLVSRSPLFWPSHSVLTNPSQFNFMSYDIYGTWDATIESIGPQVYASTNLTMIDNGLSLLWHNGIDASQVNLGLGFYGRSISPLLAH